jgi:hypothetical protein
MVVLGSFMAVVGTEQSSVQREDLKRAPGSQSPTFGLPVCEHP